MSLFALQKNSQGWDRQQAASALADNLCRCTGYRPISSQTKRQRFIWRLSGKGFSQPQLDRLRCPIGLPEVTGKLPAEIAVAVAAEIIAVYQQQQHAGTTG